MLRIRSATPLALLAVIGLAGAGTPASDPIAIYALIDRVVLEPDSIIPQRIQIHGAFVLQIAPGRFRGGRGYLYYEANPSNPRATFTDWSDLRTLAGTNRVIGFGSRFAPTGRLRLESDSVGTADTYPLGVGIYRNLGAGWPMARRVREIHAAPRQPTDTLPGDARAHL